MSSLRESSLFVCRLKMFRTDLNLDTRGTKIVANYCFKISLSQTGFRLLGVGAMTSLGQRPSASVAPVDPGAHPGLAQLSLRLSTVLTEHDVSLDTQSLLGERVTCLSASSLP